MQLLAGINLAPLPDGFQSGIWDCQWDGDGINLQGHVTGARWSDAWDLLRWPMGRQAREDKREEYIMRISRDTGRRAGRFRTGGQGLQVYELVNLALWAVVFVAAGVILDRHGFNTLAPFLAVGMVVSTMVVRWARKGR
jgi:hypothetical protein